MDIMVGTKHYKKIETYPLGKLDHLIQLVDIAITNYKACIVNYTPEKMKKCGQPYLDNLEKTKDQVIEVRQALVNQNEG